MFCADYDHENCFFLKLGGEQPVSQVKVRPQWD